MGKSLRSFARATTVVQGACAGFAAEKKMSATEDDTELRDLLIQTLENNGVLNKLKAEMRAAVFLAMDEQDKVEKCLNTQDGRLVTSLIIDFLQVFHLDFTLAVFQPEINSLNGLDSREQVSRELGITEADMNRNTPLLLELVKRGRHREKTSIFSEDRTGGICKEDLKALFGDVFPNFNKNMLERFVTDELRAGDKASSKSSDFQEFLGLYKRFFNQCQSVITHDTSDVIHNPSQFVEEKMSPSPASKGEEISHSDTSLNFGSLKGKGQGHVMSRYSEASGDNGNAPVASLKKGLQVEEEADEGDSFFDDPLPKPQKTYGCLSALGSDTKGTSNSKDKGFKDFKTMNDKTGSSVQDDDVDYDDDFNSHRSDISKSEVSIGEEIEEVSIEGPDNSDKFDEITQDLSVSQLSQTQGADYMEEVA
ncbi:unnamed protein product [Coregonus sp. 'balchen']|nr:unnamed protein product [Coregonus sp. 'balchen']